MILLSRRIFVAIRRLSFARIKGFAITRRPAASGDHYWVVSAARWAWDETASYPIDRAYWCRWRGRRGRPEVDGGVTSSRRGGWAAWADVSGEPTARSIRRG